MFEKEGIRYAFDETIGTECLSKPIEDFHFIDLADEQQEKAQCFKDGAEFGYEQGIGRLRYCCTCKKWKECKVESMYGICADWEIKE